jgi:predicted Zn-dependent protease
MKYLTIMMTVFCLAAGCATLRPVPVTEALLSSADEQMLWRRAQEEQDVIDGSGVLYQNAEIENYLNQITKKLQTNSISPDISFKIKVVKDPNLNAIAFPNGVFYVHTGILARMDNEAQLAALLAHEMTHCTHRHTLRVIRSIKDRPAYFDAVRKTLANITVTRGLAQFLGITGSMAAVSGYTRELETEADRVGLDLAVKANYDPREALKLFKHLRQEIETEGFEEPYFFGSHPNVYQRIENVNNWLVTKYRGKGTGLQNREIFQSKMSGLVLDNARLDLRQGRFHIAQRMVKKYLTTKPEDAQAYYLLGEIFRQRGQQNDAGAAQKNYEKAISLNPSFSEPHKAMGLIHYKDGERRLAKRFFESCLLLSPDTPDKAYIQGYLKLCANNGEGK